MHTRSVSSPMPPNEEQTSLVGKVSSTAWDPILDHTEHPFCRVLQGKQHAEHPAPQVLSRKPLTLSPKQMDQSSSSKPPFLVLLTPTEAKRKLIGTAKCNHARCVNVTFLRNIARDALCTLRPDRSGSSDAWHQRKLHKPMNARTPPVTECRNLWVRNRRRLPR